MEIRIIKFVVKWFTPLEVNHKAYQLELLETATSFSGMLIIIREFVITKVKLYKHSNGKFGSDDLKV